MFVHNEKTIHHLILLVLHQKYAEWIHQEMPPVWIDIDTVHCNIYVLGKLFRAYVGMMPVMYS
ncbi:hypothetical protein COK15_21200 [Bacillus cereus]|nr:hypothetical protein COK15_21200 [Bacillus cereus]